MNYVIKTTFIFAKWIKKVKDKSTLFRIQARLSRLEQGNFGDCKAIEADLFELRLFFSGGIRIYYTIQNEQVVLLLCGGDKSSQQVDIAKAKKLLREVADE